MTHKKERKKKKKKTEREEKQEIGPVVHAERERDRKVQRIADTALTSKLADQPDLTSARNKGQRHRQREGGLRKT